MHPTPVPSPHLAPHQGLGQESSAFLLRTGLTWASPRAPPEITPNLPAFPSLPYLLQSLTAPPPQDAFPKHHLYMTLISAPLEAT